MVGAVALTVSIMLVVVFAKRLASDGLEWLAPVGRLAWPWYVPPGDTHLHRSWDDAELPSRPDSVSRRWSGERFEIPMPRTLIGADVGGTKTAVAVSVDGNLAGRAEGPGAAVRPGQHSHPRVPSSR